MKNIKSFENFLNENYIFPPVMIKSKTNPEFYIKITFDDKGKVSYVDNKWHVNTPNWYGLEVNNKEIAAFVAKDSDLYIADNLVPMTSNDKTENEKYIIGNYVVYNFYPTNNNGDTRPFKFVGKILDNSDYNRVKIDIMKRLYGDKLYVRNDECKDIKLGDIKIVHVGNLSMQTSNFERFMDEHDASLPSTVTDEEIKDALHILYKNSVYATVNKVDDRIEQLFKIHATWLDKAKKYFSADDIAKKLYTYEKNLNR